MDRVKPPQHLYKYRSLASESQKRHCYELVVHGRAKFSSPDEFNDPFEFHVRPVAPEDPCAGEEYIQRIARDHNRKPEEIEQQIDSPEFLKKAAQTLLAGTGKAITVFTVSARYSDPAMWAYYADEHKGICLELSNDVRFADPYPIEYVTDRIPTIELHRLHDHDSMRCVIGTKSRSWRHEQEWRYIEFHDGTPPKPNIVRLPDDMITGVILGVRMDKYDRHIVEQWVTERDRPIRLWQAELEEDKYSVRRRLIRESA
jgi:hypothetical protein